MDTRTISPKYQMLIPKDIREALRLAPAIQDALQRFMRPWYRRRALRVFRDDTGLTVNPALWDGIVDALDRSRFFILFASPESAGHAGSTGRSSTGAGPGTAATSCRW